MSLLSALETPGGRIERNARQILAWGRVIPAGEVIAKDDAVTVEDVRAAAAAMLQGTPTLAAIGPIRKLPTLDPIAGARRSAGGAVRRSAIGIQPTALIARGRSGGREGGCHPAARSLEGSFEPRWRGHLRVRARVGRTGSGGFRDGLNPAAEPPPAPPNLIWPQKGAIRERWTNLGARLLQVGAALIARGRPGG